MEQEIRHIISELAAELGIIIESFKIGEGPEPKITVLCDTESGITSRELTKLSRQVTESEAFISVAPENFELEISSPGINYPMTEARHFLKNIGRDIVVRHRLENIENPLTVTLLSAADTQFTGSYKDGRNKEEITLNYQDIEFANIKLKW